jgi:hypothetical protein
MGWKTPIARVAAVVCAFIGLTLASAAPSSAQGLYYKEILKDGRIYVFNLASNAERFEKSGETGAALTRPGAGPNGETVVADNERALQLFYFKHGIAEPVPEPPPAAPPAPPYKFSGLVFGDYYYFAQAHDPKWQDQQGFWIRRIYFTFDYTFTPKVTTRFRLEMNGNGKLTGGALTPYVKDAYLRWSVFGRQQFTFGLQPSLTLDYVDTYWGLRHVEKTPLDLYRWDATRDTGVAVGGPLNGTGTIKYAVQFGNDSGTGGETDRFKAVRLAARYEPAAGLTVEGVYGYFARDLNADRTLVHLFAGYRARNGRVGFDYAWQRRNRADGSGGPDLDMDLVSGYAIADLKPQKFSLFARVDRSADPCPDCASLDYLPIDATAPFTLFLAGAEYYIIPSVRFSPNVEWVKYSAPESAGVPTPKDDLVWRATFYWVW